IRELTATTEGCATDPASGIVIVEPEDSVGKMSRHQYGGPVFQGDTEYFGFPAGRHLQFVADGRYLQFFSGHTTQFGLRREGQVGDVRRIVVLYAVNEI